MLGTCYDSSYKSSGFKLCLWESQLSRRLIGFLKEKKRKGVLCPSRIRDDKSTSLTAFFPVGLLRAFKMQMYFVAV